MARKKGGGVGYRWDVDISKKKDIYIYIIRMYTHIYMVKGMFIGDDA